MFKFAFSMLMCVLTPVLFPMGSVTIQAFELQGQTGSGAASVLLKVGPSAPVAGLPMTFTSVVVASSSTITPTGSVTFSGGGLTLAVAPVSKYGIATFSTSVLSPGGYTFTAAYGGDANYAAISSAPAKVNVARAQNFPGDPLANYPSFTGAASSVHDPTIIRAGSKYYVLSTDQGYPVTSNIQIRCSSDRVNWSNCGHVLPGIPAWVTQKVPGVSGLWAPEIVWMNGKYYVYYAGSTFGSNQSVIGVASNTTLDPNDSAYDWVDLGEVIGSVHTDSFNAIDPSVMVDSDGKAWMSFGSYWSGIKAVRIDPATGFRSSSDTQIYSLASRPLSLYYPIEGPSLRKHGSYYYLFVSVDFCCQGAGSTYRTLVGRSSAVTGPFVDELGVPMLQGGGTQILGADSQWAGPGGGTVLIDPEQGDLIAYHAYHVPDGTPWLHVNSLTWVNDWPVVLSIPGVQLTAAPPAPATGQAVALSVSLTGSGSPYPIPVGRISFFDGDTLLGAQSLDGQAKATFTDVGLSAGDHSFTVRYSGANVYGKTVSAADTVSVRNAGTVSIDSDTFKFGHDLVGHALTEAVVTVSNYGSAPVALAPTLTGETSFLFSSACGNTVAANSKCAVLVTFTPSHTGVHKARLNLNLAGNTGALQGVSLSGTGVSAPGVFLSRERYDFGSDLLDNQVTRSVVQIQNTQATAVSFTPTLTEERAFALANSCGGRVAAYSTCDVEVTFSPSSAGVHHGFLDFQWVGAQSGLPTHVTLTGTGTSNESVVVSAKSYDFGPDLLNNLLDRAVVKISNAELAPLSIAPVVSGTSAFQLLSSCGGEVAPFGLCEIHVAFAPVTDGPQTATLDLHMSGASQSAKLPAGEVHLSGTGTSTQRVQVSSGSYSFGADLLGKPLTRKVVRIDNEQISPLSLAPTVTGDGAFTVSNSCGNEIPAYGSCWLRVTFNPATKGTKTGQLAFNFGGISGSPISQMTLTGRGTVPASTATYSNPLSLNDPATGAVVSCPDLRFIRHKPTVGIPGISTARGIRTTTKM